MGNERFSTFLSALTLALVASACAAPEVPVEEKKSKTSHLEAGRYNADEYAPQQPDDWSCSVHTTTWMLRSTGNDRTVDQMKDYMLSRGRVTTGAGLSDASGAGLAQTLRELVDGSPDIGSTGSASFSDVAAIAGKMAVGIGGRAWNHWSGVRGYDAQRDVLLLANSANNWMGVGTEMDRNEFARLGGMSMVWLDYGGGGGAAPPPPFVEAPRPGSDPFPALHVRSRIGADVYITQCNAEGDANRVWQTDGTGPDPATYWAPAKYPEENRLSCGDAGPDGKYPLVFRSLESGQLGGAWIVQCSGNGDGAQLVFHVDADVDGHPAASFLYSEPNGECD
jgi:hypothetical protein